MKKRSAADAGAAVAVPIPAQKRKVSPHVASPPPRLADATLSSAVKALLKDAEIHEKKRAKRAASRGKVLSDLNDGENFVWLVVTFKEAPFKEKLRPYAIRLKHSLYKAGEDEVCFFVKDPQRLMKDYLAEHGNGGVTRVMGVDKLRKRYGTHEARRELSGMYDLFLVDHRVAPMMPGLLGNAFLTTKKMPVPVDLRKNVVEAIKRAVSSAAFAPRQGTSTSIRIGKSDFTAEQLIDNVAAAMEGVVMRLKEGWADIQSLSIKTNNSPSLPIYLALPTASKPYVKSDKKEKLGAEKKIKKHRRKKKSSKSQADTRETNAVELQEQVGDTVGTEQNDKESDSVDAAKGESASRIKGKVSATDRPEKPAATKKGQAKPAAGVKEVVVVDLLDSDAENGDAMEDAILIEDDEPPKMGDVEAVIEVNGPDEKDSKEKMGKSRKKKVLKSAMLRMFEEAEASDDDDDEEEEEEEDLEREHEADSIDVDDAEEGQEVAGAAVEDSNEDKDSADEGETSAAAKEQDSGKDESFGSPKAKKSAAADPPPPTPTRRSARTSKKTKLFSEEQMLDEMGRVARTTSAKQSSRKGRASAKSGAESESDTGSIMSLRSRETTGAKSGKAGPAAEKPPTGKKAGVARRARPGSGATTSTGTTRKGSDVVEVRRSGRKRVVVEGGSGTEEEAGQPGTPAPKIVAATKVRSARRTRSARK